MEETSQEEIKYKSQNEEDQGGIRRRLRDRELLKRRRAEAEEKETYQWVLGVCKGCGFQTTCSMKTLSPLKIITPLLKLEMGLESFSKRQKAEQRSGTKRRGRPRKADDIPESSFTQECEVVEPKAPVVLVPPESGLVIPALGADSLPALASGSVEPVLTWLPNPALTPVPNVALVSPPDLVTPPIAVPLAPTQDPSTALNLLPPPTAVLSTLAQNLSTVSEQTSTSNSAMPYTADLSTAPDQALSPVSDLVLPPTVVPLAPVQDLSTAPSSTQSAVSDPDFVPPPTTVPPASAQDLSTAAVQSSPPDLVSVSTPEVSPVSGPSEALLTEAVGTPYSAPQQVETLSTKTQDRENLDLVLVEDLGADETEKGVPATQARTADADMSKNLSKKEPEQNERCTIPLLPVAPQDYLPGN
ncbi:proline-rich protein 36 isoform X3 [Syngnathoides biaculeatus]|nr:proline-rich protein 36 isoform X3 [Syngnathoides biaculeatus]XP_061684610.1 proline-rich protein 36 isoform X3 [Syngnathoides biaculeatus]XP_061684611.1 proline-rich protein 36 isoform X3 [Syngnathoides biaculeatus]